MYLLGGFAGRSFNSCSFNAPVISRLPPPHLLKEMSSFAYCMQRFSQPHEHGDAQWNCTTTTETPQGTQIILKTPSAPLLLWCVFFWKKGIPTTKVTHFRCVCTGGLPMSLWALYVFMQAQSGLIYNELFKMKQLKICHPLLAGITYLWLHKHSLCF